MSDWIKSFSSQFGDAVCADDATLTAQAVQGVVPACIAAPESETQAAAMIHFAASHKIPVVPCGGGTSQGRCAPPAKGFLALSTKRLNKLIRHEPGDMVATVHAGMTVEEFQEAVLMGGQWLPIDARPDATIGGIVAANFYGPSAHGYGTLRDMILGMTVINGDGVIRKCGGKVVKNVTGYALDKLYIGSFGTLGLITEVTFKLRPYDLECYFANARVKSAADGLAALLAVAIKNIPLSVLQLNIFRNPFSPVLTIKATGTDSELQRISAEVRAASQLDFKEDFHSKLWSIKSDTDEHKSASTNDPRRDPAKTPTFRAILRIGYRLSILRDALNVFHGNEDLMILVGLNAALIYFLVLSDLEAARISAAFEKLGVNFAWENVVGVDIPHRWGKPRPEWAIMKQLKAALDPAGIMNPGRFVV